MYIKKAVRRSRTALIFIIFTGFPAMKYEFFRHSLQAPLCDNDWQIRQGQCFPLQNRLPPQVPFLFLSVLSDNTSIQGVEGIFLVLSALYSSTESII